MGGRFFGSGAAALLLLTVPVIAAAPAGPRSFAAAVASSERPDADKARDADRKPAEMMAFAGVRPNGADVVVCGRSRRGELQDVDLHARIVRRAVKDFFVTGSKMRILGRIRVANHPAEPFRIHRPVVYI